MKKTITLFFAICCIGSYSNLNAQANIITTVAGTGTIGYNGDNIQATTAELSFPYGVCLDAYNNMYIAEWGNHRVRKVDAATGIITTIAGTGLITGSIGDGGPATSALIQGPYDIRVDAGGNVFFVDANKNRVRKIDPSGTISTLAGDTAGFSGDGGPATSAILNYPTGIILDASGNIYIADQYNNRIRKITVATGIITTVVGTGTAGYTGDGAAASSARISAPDRIALDAAGDLYISDAGNNVIRKVTMSTGIITTVVGTGSVGYSGDGGAATSATLSDPSGIVFDASGNMYIADASNNVIREVVKSTGLITTLAGNHTQGYSGNGGPALSAEFFHPLSMAIYNNTGDMLIDDDENWVIRKVTAPLAVNDLSSSNTEVSVYPNPAKDVLYISLNKNVNAGSIIAIYNLLGKEVMVENVKASAQNISLNTSSLSEGIYLIKLVSPDGSQAVKKFEVVR
jgi:hypothetical protein